MECCSYINESFQEYKNEISFVIFTKKCNFNCYYCYNKIMFKNSNNIYNAYKLVKDRITPMHSALVILGGEPTVEGGSLIKFLKWVRITYPYLKIKIFTNSYLINVIKDIIDNKLCDAFSIDFKSLENKFNKTIGKDINFNKYNTNFITAINYIKLHNLYVEVRVTTDNIILFKKEIQDYLAILDCMVDVPIFYQNVVNYFNTGSVYG